jgi:helix-turn-helix protein
MSQAAILSSAAAVSERPGRQPRRPSTPSLLNDEWISLDSLARDLKKSRRTINRWTYIVGGLPFMRLGREVYYRRESVRAWLAAREQSVPNRRKPK